MAPRNYTKQVLALEHQVVHLFMNQKAEVVGAVLADLLATWIASHCCRGDPSETELLRNTLLQAHIEKVRELVPINARIIGTWEDVH